MGNYGPTVCGSAAQRDWSFPSKYVAAIAAAKRDEPSKVEENYLEFDTSGYFEAFDGDSLFGTTDNTFRFHSEEGTFVSTISGASPAELKERILKCMFEREKEKREARENKVVWKEKFVIVRIEQMKRKTTWQGEVTADVTYRLKEIKGLVTAPK